MSNENILRCPFCGSDDLCTNTWALVNDEEVEAIECNKCFAGAPRLAWQARDLMNRPVVRDRVAEQAIKFA